MLHIKTKKTIWLLLFVWLVGIAYVAEGQTASDSPTSMEQMVKRAENAGLSTQQVEELVRRGIQKGLTDEQIGALVYPAIELAEQGLPGRMIIQKAFEGLSKGVPHNRIKPVLINMKTNIQKSEKVVDPWMERAEKNGDKTILTSAGQEIKARNLMIEAAAHALAGKLTSKDVQTFFDYIDKNAADQRLNPTQLAAALQVLPELITTGENLELSNQLLAKAINAGFDPSELQQLPQAMKLAQQNSRLPAKAVANGFTRQVENGLPATQVIQNLQTGNVEGGQTPPRLQKNEKKGPDKPPAADKQKNGGGK